MSSQPCARRRSMAAVRRRAGQSAARGRPPGRLHHAPDCACAGRPLCTLAHSPERSLQARLSLAFALPGHPRPGLPASCPRRRGSPGCWDTHARRRSTIAVVEQESQRWGDRRAEQRETGMHGQAERRRGLPSLPAAPDLVTNPAQSADIALLCSTPAALPTPPPPPTPRARSRFDDSSTPNHQSSSSLSSSSSSSLPPMLPLR